MATIRRILTRGLGDAKLSQLVVYDATLIGPQSGPLVIPSLILMHGWDFTVDKIAGTDRSISGSIRKVA
jgi:hypothetical protein